MFFKKYVSYSTLKLVAESIKQPVSWAGCNWTCLGFEISHLCIQAPTSPVEGLSVSVWTHCMNALNFSYQCDKTWIRKKARAFIR